MPNYINRKGPLAIVIRDQKLKKVKVNNNYSLELLYESI